jgi:hypothetical protein
MNLTIFYRLSKTRTMITLWFLFFIPCLGFTQPPKLKIGLDKVLTTGISYFPNPLQFHMTVYDNRLYWIPFDGDHFVTQSINGYDKYLQAYSISLLTEGTPRVQTAHIDTLRIYFKKTDDEFNISGSQQEGVGVNGEYMIIPCTDKHRIFKKTSAFEYKEVESFNSKKNNLTQFFKFGEDKFLGTSLYNYHPLDDSSQFKAIIYDFKKGKRGKELRNLPYEGIEFTHFEGRFVDSRNRTLAVANTLDYKILLYDQNLILQDSITKNIMGWKPYDKSIDSKKYGIYAKSLISDYLKIDDTISRVEKMNFLNDSTILVSYKFPGANKEDLRTLDVWQKQSICKCWKNIVSDQNVEYKRKVTDTVSFEKFKPNLTLSTPALFTDSQVICISVGVDVPDKPMPLPEYKQMLQERYLNKGYGYSIFIYKWKIE